MSVLIITALLVALFGLHSAGDFWYSITYEGHSSGTCDKEPSQVALLMQDRVQTCSRTHTHSASDEPIV